MKAIQPIQRFYLLSAALLVALWLLADAAWWGSDNFFVWRASYTNLTGLLGMAAMSIGMILAVRPRAAEPLLGGLDKMYRLHKWLGISGLVLSVLHWALTKSPRYLIDLGWITRPVRGPRPPVSDPLQQFLIGQRHLAESIGEYAFYALVVLLALALIKRFPYKHFFTTHRWLPLVYLALVLHSVVLMPFGYWTTAIGPLMAALMLFGSAAAVVSLLRRVGVKRRIGGAIEAVEYHADSQVLRVDLKLVDGWAGHQAGQFAFVSFEGHREGAHPYTIASAWQGDGRLFFLIKTTGDYTATLPASLRPGMRCEVEGPYGRFVFDSARPRQIWVAGGIGITPFVARLQALAAQTARTAQAIDLFWSTRMIEAEPLRRLREDAARANVRLHVLVDERDGQLDTDRIVAAVPGWAESDVWFCGPAGFGRALRDGFSRRGLGAEHFHHELFEMR
ncbi:MAG: ferric reductase-like transmembrane domain-containing protein [Leptothrix sp. (in: b-proteobacteria)]